MERTLRLALYHEPRPGYEPNAFEFLPLTRYTTLANGIGFVLISIDSLSEWARIRVR